MTTQLTMSSFQIKMKMFVRVNKMTMTMMTMTMKMFVRVSKEKNLKLWNCLPMMHANVGPT